MTIRGILCTIAFDVLNPIIGTLIVLATVVFLWGIVRYLSAGGDTEKLKEARNFIVWGIIGLFVMVSVWGLVALLNNTFFIAPDLHTPIC